MQSSDKKRKIPPCQKCNTCLLGPYRKVVQHDGQVYCAPQCVPPNLILPAFDKVIDKYLASEKQNEEHVKELIRITQDLEKLRIDNEKLRIDNEKLQKTNDQLHSEQQKTGERLSSILDNCTCQQEKLFLKHGGSCLGCAQSISLSR
jgi:hypothetical protein